jgi:hypothetical protein
MKRGFYITYSFLQKFCRTGHPAQPRMAARAIIARMIPPSTAKTAFTPDSTGFWNGRPQFGHARALGAYFTATIGARVSHTARLEPIRQSSDKS